MLLNYVLVKLGWLPICIKDSGKKDYLAALERADNGDIGDLENIMSSEIEWSLRKGIAAAKGESVDDPDDLDKEIRMFVKEKGAVFEHQKTVADAINSTLQENYFQIYGFLKKFALEISVLFEDFREHTNWSEFDGDIMISESSDRDCYLLGLLILENWRAQNSKCSVRIYSKFIDRTTPSSIEVKVEIWRNDTMGTDVLQAKKNLNYKDGAFSFERSLAPVEFGQIIKTAIFLEMQEF